MVPKKQIGKTLDFTKVLWASSQCAIWNRINIARGIPSTELFHIPESLLRNYKLIMNTAILMLPGTQICQLVNTGNTHIYIYIFLVFIYLRICHERKNAFLWAYPYFSTKSSSSKCLVLYICQFTLSPYLHSIQLV